MKKIIFVLTLCINFVFASNNVGSINNVPIIDKLNLESLAPGIHRFYVVGSDMDIGQSWYVPIIVAKGKLPGKRLLLNTGVHGDEFNGAYVVQEILNNADINTLHGSIIGVVQASPNSLMHVSRFWSTKIDSGAQVNMNRVYPGSDENAATLQAKKVWNNIFMGNIDYALDLHTQSTDTLYPILVYADYSTPGVKELSNAFPADQLKIDLGESGTVENELDRVGIPSLTIEIGGGRVFNKEYINKTIAGVHNVMKYLKIEDGKVNTYSNTFVGNDMTSVRAKHGGYTEILVSIGENVKKGDKIAIQKTVFGDVSEIYYAPVDGKVLSIGNAAIHDIGELLVRILYKNPDTKCQLGC